MSNLRDGDTFREGQLVVVLGIPFFHHNRIPLLSDLLPLHEEKDLRTVSQQDRIHPNDRVGEQG